MEATGWEPIQSGTGIWPGSFLLSHEFSLNSLNVVFAGTLDVTGQGAACVGYPEEDDRVMTGTGLRCSIPDQNARAPSPRQRPHVRHEHESGVTLRSCVSNITSYNVISEIVTEAVVKIEGKSPNLEIFPPALRARGQQKLSSFIDNDYQFLL